MDTARPEHPRTGSILVRAQVLTTVEHRDRFLELAELLVATAEQEPGTSRYRWCATADPLRFVALEEYVDEQALFERSPASRELVAQLAQVAVVIEVQVHGHIGARLGAWVARNPHATAYPQLER